MVFQVAHMTRSEVSTLDSSLVGPGMLFLNQYLQCIMSEYVVLWMCFVSTLQS